MVMKIENYTGTADTFTFPYNPQVFDDTTNPNYDITPIPYQKHHIVVSGGGISAKSIILTGHVSGTNKLTNWRDLSKHFLETTKIKKLYFESDKFHIGIGKQIKRTHTGGRTNFIDYVATFQSFVPILFGDTEKTSGTNAGNATTYVTKITGTITDGSNDLVISDALGNEIKIDSSYLTTGQSFEYRLVEMVDSGSGIYVTEYAYCELDGTQTKAVQHTGGFGILQIASGADVSTITTTNLSSETIYFRDGYYD